MMKHYILYVTAVLLVFCFKAPPATAQVQGQRLFSIQNSSSDESYKIAKTADSGYLYTNNDTYNNFDSGSAYLSKLNSLHIRQFTIKIDHFLITDVTGSSNGDIYVCGTTLPFARDKILKFSSSGQLIWEKRIQPSSREQGMYAPGYPFKWNSIQVLRNGNILHKKSYPPSTALLIIDSNGNSLLSKQVPTLIGDIQETDQQTFLATFFDRPAFYEPATESGLLLLNSQLNLLGSKQINSTDGIPFLYNIMKATNNNYYVGGICSNDGTYNNSGAIILRTDGMLNINATVKLKAGSANSSVAENAAITYHFSLDKNNLAIVEKQAKEGVVYNAGLHATFGLFLLDTMLQPKWSKTIFAANLPGFEETQTRVTDLQIAENLMIVPFFTYQYPQGYRSQLYYVDAAGSSSACYLPDATITTGTLATTSVNKSFSISTSSLATAATHDPVPLSSLSAAISTICVVRVKPTASFTINGNADAPHEFCIGSLINVADASTNSPGSFTWTFPPQADLSNADSTLFPAISNIRFNDTGVFNIKLVSCNGNGCDSITKAIRILPEAAPVTMGNDTTLCEDASLVFVYRPQQGVTHQFLQDGEPMSASDTLVVTEAGIYTSVATGACGVVQDEVVVSFRKRLTADFTFEQPSCAFYTVNFTNASLPRNDNSVQFQWIFSDLNGVVLGSSTAENPSFTFPSRDVFKAKLIITSTGSFCNQSDSMVQTVVINANARISFAATSTCGNPTVSFTAVVDEGSAAGLQYQWNFNDEGNATGDRAVFTFQGLGEKTIEVTAVSPTGCRIAPYRQTITIHPKATVAINNLQDTLILLNSKLQLTASGAESYKWEPANLLQYHNTANPLFVPSTTGVYNIQVEGSTAQGCKAKQTMTVTVANKAPGMLPGAFNPAFGGSNGLFRFNCTNMQSLTYLRIYNLYGKPVYEQRGCADRGWDGTQNATPQPMGTYVYNWQGVDANGKLVSGKGVVMLMR